MGYILISYNIPAGERLKVGYKKQSSTGPYTYLSRYLYPTESPYSIENVSEGAYYIELTAIKSGCGGECGDPKVYPVYSIPTNSSTTTTTTSSTTTSSTTSTTSSTTSTTTTIVPLEVEWAYFEDDPGDPSTAVLDQTIYISHNQNYTIDTTISTGLYYYVIKEPSMEPIKTKYFNTDINQGDIPDQVFLSPTYSGLYRYYKTRGLASFNKDSGLQMII